MLSVLAFKKSLFAGVLDGGESEVFFQGTRLSKFIESVEQVAGAMGEADADAAVQPHTAPGAADMPPALIDPAQAQDGVLAAAEAEAEVEATEQAAPPVDPWAAIIEAGAAFLQGLAIARATGGAAPITIERDPVTGRASVRLPLPEPAVLRQLAKAFEPWLR